jgi:hypothetical protein
VLACVVPGGGVVGLIVSERLCSSFASDAYLAKLKAANAGRSLRLAGHLCSTRCQEVLQGDARYVTMLHDEVGVT